MRIHDISPLICEETAVFPGDQPFERKVALEFGKGDQLRLSSLLMTAHLGAHVDAPSHYHPKGEPMDRRKLAPYLGRSQVITVSLAPGLGIQPSHLAGTEVRAPRILFRTGSFPDPMRWRGDFNSLSAELVDWLADRGCVLAGIDTPSVDPSDSKSLEAHQALYRRGMANLEGIVLDQVPDGVYTLIALPLKIRGADASPVRAVLVEGEIPV